MTGISLGRRTLPVAPAIRADWSRAPLVIRFVDLDYTHGRGIAFRYRLRGLDDGWSTTSEHEIRYADLPAGTLRFELIAIDAVHGGISAPIGFTIRIRPPWWRRPWFYGLCTLALAAIVAGAERMRVSLLVGNQRRLEAVVRARTAEIEQARTRLEQQAGELARQAASLRRMAMSDALTGLANRRAIMTALEEAVAAAAAAAAAEGRLAVLLCDIDHFKRINDGHGHLAGDAVLAAFGARLRGIVAGPELVGRYGGEEFLVILHGEADVVAARAAGIHAALTGAPYRFGDADRPVTSSGGLARLRAGDTALSLLGRADAALYRAKGCGRNRIETERPEPAPGPAGAAGGAAIGGAGAHGRHLVDRAAGPVTAGRAAGCPPRPPRARRRRTARPGSRARPPRRTGSRSAGGRRSRSDPPRRRARPASRPGAARPAGRRPWRGRTGVARPPSAISTTAGMSIQPAKAADRVA